MSTRFKFICCLVVAGIAIFVANRASKVNDQKVVPKTPLAGVIDKALAGSQGTYGIVIKNLKTGESYSLNEHRVFQPGSLYKLWIMGETYKQIESGQIIPDEILSKSVDQLNTDFGIPLETAELSDGAVTLSVQDALEQMVTISHNYAAFLLTEKIKLASLTPFLAQNGLTESVVGTGGQSPLTTASDTALFLEKLYQGKLGNEKSTKEMIGLLTHQQLNDVIPKYLPENITVAHKTGNIEGFDNDAGIIYGPNGDYIMVLMSESDNPAGAEERMAQLSKAVYDYFSSQTKPGK